MKATPNPSYGTKGGQVLRTVAPTVSTSDSEMRKVAMSASGSLSIRQVSSSKWIVSRAIGSKQLRAIWQYMFGDDPFTSMYFSKTWFAVILLNLLR